MPGQMQAKILQDKLVDHGTVRVKRGNELTSERRFKSSRFSSQIRENLRKIRMSFFCLFHEPVVDFLPLHISAHSIEAVVCFLKFPCRPYVVLMDLLLN